MQQSNDNLYNQFSKISSGVIIRSKGEYLVGKASENKSRPWTVFKGTVEKDETFLEAALRELWEESNIDIRGKQDQYPSLRLGVIHQYKLKSKLVVLHFLDDPSGSLRNCELKCHSFFGSSKRPEIIDYKWISVDELKSHLMISQSGISDSVQTVLKWMDKLL